MNHPQVSQQTTLIQEVSNSISDQLELNWMSFSFPLVERFRRDTMGIFCLKTSKTGSLGSCVDSQLHGIDIFESSTFPKKNLSYT